MSLSAFHRFGVLDVLTVPPWTLENLIEWDRNGFLIRISRGDTVGFIVPRHLLAMIRAQKGERIEFNYTKETK
jgi:hypothetical protein